MEKIRKPCQGDLDMFQYSKPRPKYLAGTILRTLFNEIGIEGNFAADLAAYMLGYTRQHIHAMMSRTIRYNDYELLRHKLVMWKIQRMVDDQRELRAGPLREDGKRHHRDDYMKRPEEKRVQQREYMRRIRAEDKEKWRKPKSQPEG
jgi:hypothetical protein